MDTFTYCDDFTVLRLSGSPSTSTDFYIAFVYIHACFFIHILLLSVEIIANVNLCLSRFYYYYPSSIFLSLSSVTSFHL